MAMSLIWTAMVGAAILCGLATGNGPAVALSLIHISEPTRPY